MNHTNAPQEPPIYPHPSIVSCHRAVLDTRLHFRRLRELRSRSGEEAGQEHYPASGTAQLEQRAPSKFAQLGSKASSPRAQSDSLFSVQTALDVGRTVKPRHQSSRLALKR